MSEQILVGIVGRLGVGKSTLAAMLADEIEGAEVVAFADALKDDVAQLCTESVPTIWSADAMRQWLDEHKRDVFGPLLQGMGEFWRQMLGEDYWIRCLADHLPPRAIVADVRYPNEAAWIKSRGGLLVAVSGPCRREGDQRDTEHPSERYVADIARGADVPVVNDWTLDRLRSDAGSIARMALGATS